MRQGADGAAYEDEVAQEECADKPEPEPVPEPEPEPVPEPVEVPKKEKRAAPEEAFALEDAECTSKIVIVGDGAIGKVRDRW